MAPERAPSNQAKDWDLGVSAQPLSFAIYIHSPFGSSLTKYTRERGREGRTDRGKEGTKEILVILKYSQYKLMDDNFQLFHRTTSLVKFSRIHLNYHF